MMNKKAIAPFWIEIIGGTIASIAIIYVILLISSSSSSSLIDAANANSLDSFTTAIAFTMNKDLSSGEHTIVDWNLYSSGGDIYYAFAYIPQKSARILMEVIFPGSSRSYQYTGTTIPIKGESGEPNPARAVNSFANKLDTESIFELQKCNQEHEACMCLFKIEYKKCAPKDNLITINVDGPTPQGLIFDDVYDFEIYEVNKWVEWNFIYNLQENYVKDATLIECIPMMEKGCVYLDENSTAKACIPHYNNDQPIVWMHAAPSHPLEIESINLKTRTYDKLDLATQLKSFDKFPRVVRFKELFYTETTEEAGNFFEFGVSTEYNSIEPVSNRPPYDNGCDSNWVNPSTRLYCKTEYCSGCLEYAKNSDGTSSSKEDKTVNSWCVFEEKCIDPTADKPKAEYTCYNNGDDCNNYISCTCTCERDFVCERDKNKCGTVGIDTYSKPK